jgi:hypothetical protein
MLPTYKDANKLKCIAFTDNFLANDYVGEGKSYEEALKAASLR